MADKRKRKRAGSEKRDQKHRPGGEWTTISVPENMSIWKPKEGTHRIDIVPYEAGEGNEYADSGEWYYERTYFRHVGIGPDGGMYVCLAKTFKKPCPVCEHRGILAADPDADADTEKMIKALAPKERQLWLIFDHAAKEDGVQLWDFSHYCFGALMEEERRAAEEDEDFIRNFDDDQGGATLKVRFKDESGGGFSFLKASAIDFKPRPKGLDAKLLEHGVCLDSILKEMDYDELKAIFLQTGGSSDKPPKETTVPESNGSTPTAEEFGIEAGDPVIYDNGPCTVFRISKDGTSLVLMDSEDNPIKAVGVDEVEKTDGKDKETPKQAPVEQVVAAVDPGDDDGFDEDWDDD